LYNVCVLGIIISGFLIMNELVYKFAENGTEYNGVRELRRRVFVEEQGIPDNLVFGGDPGDDDNLIVVLDGQSVIATARIVFSSHDTAKIERMAVLEAFRNQGIGRKMITFIISEIKNRGFSKVYLHAQYTAVDFYKNCGFHNVGNPFTEAGIKHIKMELE
jgi:predicted GNAT family N-acyltransferase